MKSIILDNNQIRSILNGNKTQFRKPIKPQPIDNTTVDGNFFEGNHNGYVRVDNHPDWRKQFAYEFSPYQIDDVLYVRETFLDGVEMYDGYFVYDEHGNLKHKTWYKADGDLDSWYNGDSDFPTDRIPWKSPATMSRESARIFLRVTDVRVQRIQDITDEEALLEGVEKVEEVETSHGFISYYKHYEGGSNAYNLPRNSYRTLWESINGSGSWDSNIWVWVVTFEQIEKPD